MHQCSVNFKHYPKSRLFQLRSASPFLYCQARPDLRSLPSFGWLKWKQNIALLTFLHRLFPRLHRVKRITGVFFSSTARNISGFKTFIEHINLLLHYLHKQHSTKFDSNDVPVSLYGLLGSRMSGPHPTTLHSWKFRGQQRTCCAKMFSLTIHKNMAKAILSSLQVPCLLVNWQTEIL